MASLFLIQFWALFVKNWTILWKYRTLNILRCFVGPVIFGIFMGTAKSFLTNPNNYGLGNPAAIANLHDKFDGSSFLVWADGTDGSSSPTPSGVMARVTSGFSPRALSAVKKVNGFDAISDACPQNFNSYSNCYAGVYFASIPASGGSVNYTIRADGGLSRIDVINHSSDVEKQVIPLQWAVDRAIIELKTGATLQNPLEWPYTKESNKEQSYVRGIRSILVIALLVGFLGISYQLPGAYSTERALALTPHLKAMGLLDSARIVSWHLSLSLAYLPAWVIIAITWHFSIFTAANVGLILVVHVVTGLSLASYSIFVASFFGKSPQLAAVFSTFAIVFLAIIALVLKTISTGGAVLYTVLFPPGFYIFAIRAICGYEAHQIGTNATKGDPDRHLTLLPIIIAGIIDCFIWPLLAVLVERRTFDARSPKCGPWWAFWRKNVLIANLQHPSGMAVSISNLEKTFPSSWFSKKGNVTAVADLSLDIPKSGIFVLLGSNGAGKSTLLSIIGGLMGRTGGSVTFEGNVDEPARGTIGIVPQKNVLFPDLTCLQTLRMWRAVKWSANSLEDEDLEQLLRDCDLEKKIGKNAGTLSGGQKRKLQLAIGLVGGSKIVLVDECTSGVDPLSRRAIWRTLMTYRHERTIILTTHFLDEADLLADKIAILAAPGKLVAEGSPVALKRSFGSGYSVQVTFGQIGHQSARGLLHGVREIAPHARVNHLSENVVSYHLKSGDPSTVEAVLRFLEDSRKQYSITSADVLGTTIEDIFLKLMRQEDGTKEVEKAGPNASSDTLASIASPELHLADGRKQSPIRQALTIFHKRALVFRRSWLSLVMAVIIGIAGACIPIVFLSKRQNTCVLAVDAVTPNALYLPSSPLAGDDNSSSALFVSPSDILSSLGDSTNSLQVTRLSSNASFVDAIRSTYRNVNLGGISIGPSTGASTFAWEASPPGRVAPTMLNLLSNVLFNRALTASGKAPSLIQANYEEFPGVASENFKATNWVGFFSAFMAVYPAFFALYVSRERRSSVQAMQFSNGLANPVGLWLGHLLFDSIFTIVLATVIVVVFAAATNQFKGLGFFWFIIVQYGITATLFAYCSALVLKSPLACFAAVTAYQLIVYALSLTGYFLILSYAKPTQASHVLSIFHFTTSWVAPMGSLLRASLLSVNLFSLLCEGNKSLKSSSLIGITGFGGPILYLFISAFAFFAILVLADSGVKLPHKSKQHSTVVEESGDSVLEKMPRDDVLAEARAVADSSDILRVAHMSKSYEGEKVVDDLSVGVSRGTVFAMLGPNGAGKTTTFNIIRGEVAPDSGSVYIDGSSAIRDPRTTRLSLGVCPQFTAIDSQLTVSEHLMIYGRLKGLGHGEELRVNVAEIMKATTLEIYADRLASKLSGGNQRKLMLAIALIGNPSVILIDEFSTGIDAKIKREMWGTLRNVAVGKAVVITTHSMEEASALANKVGIIAKRLLAVGSINALSSRYAAYEVHFTCRTREDVTRAQMLMARCAPEAKLAADVSTRFEVPVSSDNGADGKMTLAELFRVLAAEGAEFEGEYTVEKGSLESVFMKVIGENDVVEEDVRKERRRWWRF